VEFSCQRLPLARAIAARPGSHESPEIAPLLKEKGVESLFQQLGRSFMLRPRPAGQRAREPPRPNHDILALNALVAGATASETRMKIYISADMEGVAGVVSEEQLTPEGFEYPRAREFMNAEVNAAIQAAAEAGRDRDTGQ
jgi:hypothetical protein